MGNWYLYCKKGDFAAISQKFNISPILARILVNRGLKDNGAINEFLNGSIDMMHDPFLFDDMRKAVSIILHAVEEHKKIRIIGDYDVDGVASSIVLKKFLCALGADADVRLPHRVKDGYGMNEKMAEQAFEDGIGLIVTCDNGISAADAVRKAEKLGIDVIITDHHEPPENIPPAQAVIDAKIPGCTYPYKELCGAAVAYKLDQAILKVLSESSEDSCFKHISIPELENLLDDLLQFAGMATITDIVPLVGENRIFAKEGIKRLRTTASKGLLALAKEKEIELGTLNEYHVGFILGPCINSAGRLADAMIAFELLDTNDNEKAAVLASQLNSLNDQRKSLTQTQAVLAEESITSTEEYKNGQLRVICIYLPDAHESVAGIIAGRLKEKFNRPALVITDSAEGLKGSGRSTEDYDLVKALERNKNLLKKYGGHAKAAGFTLNCTADELSDALNNEKEAKAIIPDKKIWIDMQLPLKYVTEDLVNEISLLEPFGLDNERPQFAEKHVTFKDVRIYGKQSNVLKMQLISPEGYAVNGVYFSHAIDTESEFSAILEHISSNADKAEFSILYKPAINSFRNERYPQAVIDAIEIE